MSHGSKRGATLRSIFFEPLIWVALGMNGLSALLWLRALETLDLSYASPFLALNYVLIPLLAAIFLSEKINRRRMVGIGIICLGVVLSGMS
ncbi:MAG: EamA family transporter [Verrucomicrobiota bacterium]